MGFVVTAIRRLFCLEWKTNRCLRLTCGSPRLSSLYKIRASSVSRVGLFVCRLPDTMTGRAPSHHRPTPRLPAVDQFDDVSLPRWCSGCRTSAWCSLQRHVTGGGFTMPPP